MVMAGVATEMEVGRLLAENRTLSEDLRQCQSDKDFVWSLWKKLQVSNPDVTQAVGLVVQREKEKAEVKDRKVLEILQMKDDKIEELQNLLSSRTRELSETTIRHSDMHDELSRLRREVDVLRDHKSTVEMQMRTIENRERNLDNVHKRTVNDAEMEKRELFQRIQNLSSDLEKARSEKADEMALRVQLENKVRTLERDVSNKVGRFETMIKELEEAKSLLRRFESQIQQQNHEIEFKNHELEAVRKELSELWTNHNQLTEHSSQQADLIRQIQSLQTDTQKIMKNQEEAYSEETTSFQKLYTDLSARYEVSKKAESELRQQVLELKKKLLDKDDVISDLQCQLDAKKIKASRHDPRRSDSGSSGSFLDVKDSEPVGLGYKVESLQQEIDMLKSGMKEKDRIIEKLEKDAINQTIEFDVARLNRHERTHSTPAREFRSIGLSPMKGVSVPGSRARSMSPLRGLKDPQRKIFHMQKQLEDSQNLYKLKLKELEELKKAHAKRLERLKSVQDNYKNVKEQLKTLEAEYYGSKKKKTIKRADPKELRREDTDAVWNELAFFKSENRNLVVEKMSLEEDNDSLRVQASQDAATIHELRVQLEQEKEERRFDKRKQDRELQEAANFKSEMALLKSEVQNKQVLIERVERDLHEVRTDRDALLEEKRLLKTEILELKQEASQTRMDTADLKREIQRLKRELEEEQSIKQMTAAANKPTKSAGKPVSKVCRRGLRSKNNSSMPKQYQKTLNRSIERMRNMFEGFDEEGWEEIAESCEEEEDATESDTLGHEMVHRSRLRHRIDSSSSSPELRHMRSKSVPMKQSARARQAIQRHTQRMERPSKRFLIRSDGGTTEVTTSSSGEQLARKVILKERGTSPMRSPMKEISPSYGVKKGPSPAQSLAIRQLKPMKQRVGYLQQQVVTLRDSRSAALKALEEHKEANNTLQSDLNLAHQRLRVTKQSVQKLNNDIEKLQKEKAEVESRLASKEDSNSSLTTAGRSEQEWKLLESRLKVTSNELARQSAAVRQLRNEHETTLDQLKNFQEKVQRLERDNNQKRTLLEDHKNKMRQAQESARLDADSLEEVETRVKLLQDANDKLKVQLESYKKRLGAVTREKREYEERFLQITTDVEKKTKQLLDCQNKKMELESALSELEHTAKQQLKGLAHQSEVAIESAQQKLTEAHGKVHMYQQFVKTLSQEVLRRVQQTRAVAREVQSHREKEAQNKSNASMQRAQNLAKDILNLSQSDLDDIMSANGEAAKLDSELEAEKRRDKKWSKKCDKLMNCKDDFVLPLVDLFIQKMEERNEITSRLHSS